MILKTEAIVLKSIDLRETSRIVTFFTRGHGKLKGVMKGIRKDPKKFGSSVDRFTVNDIVYYHYSRTDIHLISHCDQKEFFPLIRSDYQRGVAAHYGLELVDAVMPVEEPNEKIYQLLGDYLTALGTVKDIDKLVHLFQIKILSLSGFRPHIDACVKCHKKIAGRARFSMRLGGLICSQCPTFETTFTMVSPGTVATILHVERNTWAQCLRLSFPAVIKTELKFVLNHFLVYHLERYLQSLKFLG